MKNLTISLPESTLEALRKKARASGKSLNAWLRELLSKEVESEDEWVEEILRVSERLSGLVGENRDPNWKWNREEIYEERLSGH